MFFCAKAYEKINWKVVWLLKHRLARFVYDGGKNKIVLPISRKSPFFCLYYKDRQNLPHFYIIDLSCCYTDHELNRIGDIR